MVSLLLTHSRERRRASRLLAGVLFAIACVCPMPRAHAGTIGDIMSITVGGVGGPAGTGLRSGVYGSATPVKNSNAYTYANLYSVPVICRPVQGCTNGETVFSLGGLSSNPGQTYLDTLAPEVGVSGITLTGSSASYAYANGVATWTWTGSSAPFDFTGTTAIFAVTHSAPPEGYLDVKYQIVGVTYAPPGPKSTVSYGQSLQVGSGTTNSSSLTNTTSESLSLALGASLAIFSAGSSVTFTNSYSEEEDTSSSITLQATSSTTYQTPGATPTSTGTNHNDDIVWVWLNPEVKIAAANGAIGWLGYTYNPQDDANDAMEVVALYVAWLKNPSMIAKVDPGLAGRLQRAWDTTGLGGLTSADYATILQADPLASSTTYNPATDTSHRFDEMTALGPVLYEPPPAGGGPITTIYTLSTQTTTSSGKGASFTYSSEFTIDAKISADLIGYVSADFKVTDSYTTVDKWSTSLNSTTGKTASLSVTGPSGPITGPTEYQVWRDNVYGSFMFYPVPPK